MRRHIIVAVAVFLSGTACTKPAGFGEAEQSGVVAAVAAATRRFEAAQRARDAEAAIGLLAQDFTMYSDGVRLTYDSVSASIRRSFGSLQYLEPGFRNINVRAFSATAALSTFQFRDSMVTAAGSVTFTGATTLLWELRDGRWLVTYGHADHHPGRS